MPTSDDWYTGNKLEVRALRRRALAEAVIAARTRLGLSQSELARRAGLSRSAVVKLETGESGFGVDRLWDLAAALGLRPSALLAAAEADEEALATLGLDDQ